MDSLRSNLAISNTGLCPCCSKAIPTSAKIASCSGNDVDSGASGTPCISSASASQIVVRAGKNRGLFIVLGILLGLFGIHNFYAGYYGKGALQLLITITWGMIYMGIIITSIWVLIDLLTVRQDAEGNVMTVKGP
jgi:TM2 domain-containing membrane protein YozV